MYEEFFKLTQKPFELLPNPDFIYLSKSHKRAITYIDYGIRERAGFILLTGEIGSGKTTLIRDLVKKRDEQVLLAKVFNTRVDSEQLFSMINDDFGLSVQGKDKVTLLRDLNLFLIGQYAIGKQPVLIIDEAQNLSSSLLEEIRMLSNLETDNAKLLQIILVGQPELRATLADPSLRQLRQRISINCNINPLTRTEIISYIKHRLEVAGNSEAVEFDSEALEIVYKYSRGIPRLINIMCDFLMISAFSDESKVVTGGMARDVVTELDFEEQFWGDSGAVSGEAERSSRSSEDISVEAANVFMFDLAKRIEHLENVDTPIPTSDTEKLEEQLLVVRQQQAVIENTLSKDISDIREQVITVRDELTKHSELLAQQDVKDKKGFFRSLFS